MIKENQSLLNKMNMLTDVAILFMAMPVAYFIRFYMLDGDPGQFSLIWYMAFTFALVPLQFVAYSLFGLYGSFRVSALSREASYIIGANFVLMTMALSASFVVRLVNISRWLVVFFFASNVALSLGKRMILRMTLSSIRQRGYNLKSVIIVGSGEVAGKYLQAINQRKMFGFRYCGYVADNEGFQGKRLGNYSQLYQILSTEKPDEVVCAMDVSDAGHLQSVINDCERTGTKVSIIPFCYQYMPARPYIDQIDGIPLINVRKIPLDNLGNAFLKRTMDIAGALIGILLTSPVLVLTALLIPITSPGPIIFKQERIGLNKAPFIMYKFRSMVVNGREKNGWSTPSDTRKTPFGAFIRKFSIDELPQLFNVLKGDMSLVGPRPEVPHFVESFKNNIPLYMVKHQVKPGMTGLAQIKGYRGDTSIEKRIAYDIQYIEEWNIFLDLYILLVTVFKAFKNEEKLQ